MRVAFYEPGEYRGIGAAQASQADIQQAVAILREAKRPLIVAGSAASYARAGEAVQEFIETTRLPLLTEGDARGMVSDEHPYCLGFFDQGLSQTARKIREADVVMMLGRKQDLIIGYAMSPTIAPDARIIQVDPSEAEIGRNRGVAVGIAGDVEATVRQMTAEASKHSWQELEWIGELRAEGRAWQEHLESLAVADVPMHAMYVHRTVMQMLQPDDYLIFDGGDYCHFARAYLPARMPKSWLYVTPSGMLGHTFPTALAAKLAHPDRRVIAFSGDGAFGFNGIEFDTAVRHNLPIVCVLGERLGMGHRQADSAGRLWQAGRDRPATHAVRPGGARSWRARRGRGEPGGATPCPRTLPETGAAGAHQRAGAAGGKPAWSGGDQ